MKHYVILLLFLLANFLGMGQETEIVPPYHIKSAAFVQADTNVVPIFHLGDSFKFQFDDLHGTEENYYYKLIHCDYDWKISQLSINEYITGFNEQRIIQYENSFNTVQIYSHYTVDFPNKFTQIKVSGNFILMILNEDKEVVLSRKFMMYESLVSVPLQIKRARNVSESSFKHNLDFTIKSATINFQSPLKNVKVALFQNGKFNNAIYNIKPQYTIGNDLIYKYDQETQFWAGNEYLFFENKIIRAANNSISKVDTGNGLYSCYLYQNQARLNMPYTYFPDANGNFVPKNANASNSNLEADYAWIYFSLSAPSYFGDKNIYITGMFNNNSISDENKMDYDEKKGIYHKALMVKQGFTNYEYTLSDSNGNLDPQNAIDGNFIQTENEYTILVYYRENNQRYDRIIGQGTANSTNIIN